MPTDFFGCLHTEDVRGHKVRVLTLFSKKPFLFAYARQNANVLSVGPACGRTEVTTKIACIRKMSAGIK